MNILIRLEYNLIKMVNKHSYGCNNANAVLIGIGIGGIGLVTSLVIG